MADPFYGSVVAQLHCNGADAGTTFTDEKGKTWTAAGNAQLDTAQLKWGTASGQFDGTGDLVTTPDHVDFQFGAGDFTLELWARFNTTTGDHTLLGKRASASDFCPFLLFQSGTAVQFYSSSNGSSFDIASAKAIGTITTGQWYHIAVTRSGSTWYGFLNGVLGSGFPFSSSATVINNASAVALGAHVDASNPFNGWLDDIRITKGIARYTAAFTPPAEEFSDVLGDPIATAVLTLPVKTIIAAGTTGEFATAELTQPLKTVVANGTSGTIATAELTLPGKTISSSAVATGSGTAELTAPSKTIVASSLTGTVATAVLVLPAKTIEAHGPTSSELVMPSKTIQATGFTGGVATAELTLPSKTMEATGLGSTLASAEIVKPAKTVQATGLSGTWASAEIVLPLRNISASAGSGSLATAALILPVKVIEFSGYGDIVVSAMLNMPVKTMQAYSYATLPETYRAWALNMKNAALTEYSNFQFNSFAVFNGVVLAANGDGIRALGLEDADGATAINGLIRSGKMAYGDGNKMQRVPRIYFSGSSEKGDLEFSTINDKGERYSYPLEANTNTEVQQRRVKVGRGQSSRYWQWEIAATDGGDFSVDALIVGGDELSRRV